VPGQLDAIVACTSLHHVADLAAVLDLAAEALVPGGRAVACRLPGEPGPGAVQVRGNWHGVLP
jgi:SAM-dependent methyltransferase